MQQRALLIALEIQYYDGFTTSKKLILRTCSVRPDSAETDSRASEGSPITDIAIIRAHSIHLGTEVGIG
jgi:hypothetical protein